MLARRLLRVAVERTEGKQAFLGHLHQRLGALALDLDEHVHVGAVAEVDAAFAELLLEQPRQQGRIGILDVVLVEPAELVHVEYRRGAIDIGEIEKLAELLAREDLLVAM